MVTMTDLKKVMKEIQREYTRYLKSDEAEPNLSQSMAFQIEAFEGDGGMAKYVTDKAENWYIADTEPYYDSGICYIYLARFTNADDNRGDKE